MRFTSVYKKVPEGYIGFVQELLGANTQGRTLNETRANLQEAIEMTLEADCILVEESLLKSLTHTCRPAGAWGYGDSACAINMSPRWGLGL